jgi:hypothetical protein
MPTLRALQGDFALALLHHAVDHLAPHVQGQQADARILLYAHTVYGTLTQALEALYPVIARLLGRRCFDGLARRCIRETPSRSGDLHQFGEPFADFIAATPLAVDHPYLPDTARLEWLMHRIFHAVDTAPLDPRRLHGLAPEQHAAVSFRLAPASALLASPWPVHRIWQANQADAEGYASLDAGPARLLVLRGVHGIDLIPLASGEYALLSALARNETLARAVEQALATEPDFDPVAALARALQRGLIADFCLSGTTATGDQ